MLAQTDFNVWSNRRLELYAIDYYHGWGSPFVTHDHIPIPNHIALILKLIQMLYSYLYLKWLYLMFCFSRKQRNKTVKGTRLSRQSFVRLEAKISRENYWAPTTGFGLSFQGPHVWGWSLCIAIDRDDKETRRIQYWGMVCYIHFVWVICQFVVFIVTCGA